MTGILIAFDFASMLLLGWVFVAGFYIPDASGIAAHIRLALIATALSVFAHSMTMMYVVAVGRMIREAVEKASLSDKYVAETKSYRKVVFRYALIAMLFVMMNTILAGGAHTKMFPLWIHTALAIVTLVLNAYSVYLEIRYLITNHLLGHKVAQEYSATQDKR
jgi:hypothetical protein